MKRFYMEGIVIITSVAWGNAKCIVMDFLWTLHSERCWCATKLKGPLVKWEHFGALNISYKSSQQFFFPQVVENIEKNKVKFCFKFGQV